MTQQPERREYLAEAGKFVEAQAKRLLRIWNTEGDNYAKTFINNEASGINNSFNLLFIGLYNAANTAKVTKIGKPGGFEKSPRTNPKKVKAPYSDESLALTQNSIEVIEVENLHAKLTALNIWMGVDARSILSVIITSTDNDGD